MTDCPFPQPPGSINGTAFGPQPLPFPDRTLEQLQGVNRLDGEIIVQLAGTQCLQGVSFNVLLARLMMTYPASDWTAQLLQERLTIGRKRGRFCLAATNTWVLNNMMVQNNYVNQKFQGLVTSIDRVPIFNTVVQTIHNGVFDGARNAPLCDIPRLLENIPGNVLQELQVLYGTGRI